MVWPLVTAQVHPQAFAKAALVSDCGIASEVGSSVLKQGGNAVDAAVATGFALAVTFPAAGNLGGGGFLVYRGANGEVASLDFREVAPALATANMYLDAEGNVTSASRIGHKAAGVPGTVRGLWLAHQKYGKLKWAQLVEPARLLAANGFPLGRGLASSIASQQTLFGRFPASKRAFFKPDGKTYGWKENWKQPDLAKTLARIRDFGDRGFYEGATAKLIAADMKQNGGLISEVDLKNYKAVWRTPLQGSYRGYSIVTMPPPSSGGVCLLQMLGIIEGFDLKKEGFLSSGALHPMIESMKYAFADRSTNLGDPDFVKVPVQELLNPQYLAGIRALIEPQARPAAEIRPFGEAPHEGENTTHFSIVDGSGSAVSLTYTLNTGYGSGAVVEGAGFLLNNEMDDFAAKVGTPNVFGLIQGPQNAIAPGKRPLSSMTPSIVFKDDKLAIVLGSPGGPTIINTVYQSLVNVIDHGMDDPTSRRRAAFPSPMGPGPNPMGALWTARRFARRARGERPPFCSTCRAYGIVPRHSNRCRRHPNGGD